MKAVQARILFLMQLMLSVALFPLVAESASSASKSTSVTIESARRTEYSKDTETGEEIISFIGAVSLEVKRDDQLIRIQAEQILFNRTRNTLYADGDITFSRKSSGTATEQLTARTLLFNIDTLEGVFDDGLVVQETSDNLNLPTGSSLYVSSDLFGRDDSGTVAFDTGTLTFCDDPDPHWQIKASRIWLLPGNEFSFFNAVLYVGRLPVMYFPFFYYPKDEMVFNPVFSYDARRGYSFQTTTYLIGRKPLDKGSDDGLFSFMRTTELKKQERDGLFLRNLDEKDTLSDTRLKVMADLYSNLGVMVGADGVFKPDAVVTDLSFTTLLGFSNTLFPAGSQYTTFSPGTSARFYDHSYLLGLEIPFRFYGELSLKMSKSPFSLSLSLPLYSDPYFASDFLDREESMDWINYFLQNPVLLSDSSSSSGASTKTSFQWSLSGSVTTPDFVKDLKPYVTEMKLTKIESTIKFNSRINSALTGENASYTPGRSFFYPETVYPLMISGSVSGTLYSTAQSSSSSGAAQSASGAGSASSDSPDSGKTARSDLALVPPESLDPDAWLNEPDTAAAAGTETDAAADAADGAGEPAASAGAGEPAASAGAAATATAADQIPEGLMPAVQMSRTSVKDLSGFAYSLNYTITPAISTALNYDTGTYAKPADIDWTRLVSSYVSVKSPVQLKSTASWKNSFLTLTDTLSFTPEYQEHPTVSATRYPAGSSSLADLMKADYQARKADVSLTNAFSLKPFVLVPSYADTSLTWNSTVKLVRTSFTGTAASPAWQWLTPGWNKDTFSTHDMTLVLSAKEGSCSQKFTLKANLPPLTESYAMTLNLTFPICTSLSFSSTYKKESEKTDTWQLTPLSQSSSWSIPNTKLSVSQSWRYNFKDNHSESFSLSLSGYGAKAAFNMSWTNPYVLTDRGWSAKDQKQFIPTSFSLSYGLSGTTYKSLENRMSFTPALNTSISLDLNRPTNSSFSFKPSFTCKINNFLDLTFSAESKNDVLFRYVQDLWKYDVRMPGEQNILVDLFNSFAFWDTSLRKASGFKIKSFSVKLTHDLHDWTLNSEFKVEPRLLKDVTPYRYDFSPYFMLSVVWRPMSSLKTTIQDKYGTFVLNPD